MALDRFRQQRRDRFRGADDRRVRAVPRRELQFPVQTRLLRIPGLSKLIPSGPVSLHAWIPSTTPGLIDMPSGNVTTASRKCGVAVAPRLLGLRHLHIHTQPDRLVRQQRIRLHFDRPARTPTDRSPSPPAASPALRHNPCSALH